MSVKYYANRIRHVGLKESFKKISLISLRRLESELIRLKDCYFYRENERKEITVNYRLFDSVKVLSQSNIESVVIEKYLDHQFDLLGSGWVNVDICSNVRGLNGEKTPLTSNLRCTLNRDRHNNKEVLSKFIGRDYNLIDWQRDFKSGYSWSTNVWYRDCSRVVGKIPNVDIKVPWELARLQHLPQLAIFALSVDEDRKNILINEIKDQVLDFIIANPVRFGVNWVCTMDVAIRAANVLIAVDIIKSIPEQDIISSEIESIIIESIYDHGKHVVGNLEWSVKGCNNHYLANVAGLLFISSYLDGDAEIDEWLAFSIQELFNCISTQFLSDGSNFEASTCYHRLSGEMVGYSLALILGLDDEKLRKLECIDVSKWKFKPSLKPLSEQNYAIKKDINGKRYISIPKEIISKIANIPRFTLDITKPNNEVCQVGDNDSGQFLKLSTNGRMLSNFDAENLYLNLDGYCDFVSRMHEESTDKYWDENILDHRSLVSLYRGIVDRDLSFASDYHDFESLFSGCLAKGKVLAVGNVDTSNIQFKNRSDLVDLELEFRNEYNIELEGFDIETLSSVAYPDFGMFIFKADGFFLSIFAGDIGQNGVGGHCHSDKLSIELFANGRDYLRDPGTYLYTPSLEYRDKFRSIAAHNSPKPKFSFEPCDFLSPFYARTNFSCEVISYSERSLSVICTDDNLNFRRDISIASSKLTITDYSNVALKKELTQFEYYSPGYGKLSRNDLSVI